MERKRAWIGNCVCYEAELATMTLCSRSQEHPLTVPPSNGPSLTLMRPQSLLHEVRSASHPLLHEDRSVPHQHLHSRMAQYTARLFEGLTISHRASYGLCNFLNIEPEDFFCFAWTVGRDRSTKVSVFFCMPSRVWMSLSSCSP